MIPERWNVNPRGYNNYLMQRDILWADIKACVVQLSLNCKRFGGDGEEFAPLHRVEGGFMCVDGPGFQTNEIVDSKLPNQPHRKAGDAIVRKAIRFQSSKMYDTADTWPSNNHSFLDNPNLRDSTVVLPVTLDVLQLKFEGENCNAWTKSQCRGYADIICDTLKISPIHANTASRFANNRHTLTKIAKKKRR